MDDDNTYARRSSDTIYDTAAEVKQVDIRLNRMEAVTENLSSGLTSLSNDVKSLAQVIREGNKTNWGVMATWAGVAIMMVIALGNGYVGQPLNQLSSKFDKIDSSIVAHISDGHPATVLEQVADNQEGIINQDRILRERMDEMKSFILEIITSKEEMSMSRFESLEREIDHVREMTKNLPKK